MNKSDSDLNQSIDNIKDLLVYQWIEATADKADCLMLALGDNCCCHLCLIDKISRVAKLAVIQIEHTK